MCKLLFFCPFSRGKSQGDTQAIFQPKTQAFSIESGPSRSVVQKEHKFIYQFTFLNEYSVTQLSHLTLSAWKLEYEIAGSREGERERETGHEMRVFFPLSLLTLEITVGLQFHLKIEHFGLQCSSKWQSTNIGSNLNQLSLHPHQPGIVTKHDPGSLTQFF